MATRLFDEGFAVAVLPRLDDWDRLRRDLDPLEVAVAAYGPPDRIDVRRLRERQGLTQEAFAAAFGLDLSTLRNWEQGRSEPDRASRSLLRTIATNPAAIREALARTADPTLP
ncbi:helix-turn-helix domain-containing protein [Methylobacterium durans]|uniref:helix-turn-helix domain-containing protein n=1 Tax=Methylobacterium durans TaxID=2202825 RepID=UPI001F251D15|nr:helix-turn-helix domain-containing protein [Methylobacterium durans]